jgi:NAD+ kinase
VCRVGLYVSLHREQARQAAVELATALCGRGVRVQASEAVAELVGAACRAVAPDEVLDADLVVVLGGDGSLLHTARRAAPVGVPVLGIDMGSFGFLADSRFAVLMERLDDVLQGRFQLEERLMLEALVRRGAETLGPWPGLNDAVMGVLSYSNLLRFAIQLDEEQVAEYAADGLIIATPTGSTAYALSAGGPVVDPKVESLLITAICPHTLQSRPVVVAPETVVSVAIDRVGNHNSGVVLDLDGLRVADLEAGDTVVVRRAPYSARLVRIGAGTFFGRLRDKLQWGMSH